MLAILGLIAALTPLPQDPGGPDVAPGPGQGMLHPAQAAGGGGEAVDRAERAPAEEVERIWRVMQLEGLMPVLRAEAVHDAERMQADGAVPGRPVDGAGAGDGSGADWAGLVGRIHEPARMEALLRHGLAEALPRADPQLIDRALAFHASDLGRRVIGLEVSARRALLEAGVEEAARADFADAIRAGEPRAVGIRDVIRRADLIAPNLAGAMNAALAFSRGFERGGGFDMPPTEQEMAAAAWAQRDQIEAEAGAWLEAFLRLAYDPLTDAELTRFADHAVSAEGQALSRVLFAGFDAVFDRTSYDMGLAAALQGRGEAL